jgi:hypothetical protein
MPCYCVLTFRPKPLDCQGDLSTTLTVPDSITCTYANYSLTKVNCETQVAYQSIFPPAVLPRFCAAHERKEVVS